MSTTSSSWIQSLKAYHMDKKTKYRIPRKDSEEYQTILKFHQSRCVPKVESATPIQKPKSKKQPKTKEPIMDITIIKDMKPKRVYKKKPKNLVIPPIVDEKKSNDGDEGDDEAFTDNDE